MHTVSVVGSDTTVLVERLVERLAGRGTVATVVDLPAQSAPGHEEAIRYTAAGATVTYGHADDGWSGYATTDRPMQSLLDELAPDHDYCLLEQVRTDACETIAVGATEPTAPLYTVDDPEQCALEPIVDQIEQTTPHVTLETLVEAVTQTPTANRAGAIATFTGRVREKDHPDDAPTEHLDFEMYDDVAADRLESIRTELEQREDVHAVRLHHKTGVIERGEEIVYVVVLAGHRRAAFRTVEDGIDRLKDEVPIFKKEVTTDETFWVHDRTDCA